MNFNGTDEFSKEFKRLSRKFRSLDEDLEEFKKVLATFPLGTGKHFAVLHREGQVVVVKARLFCKYLRKSSLRIIYAYHEAGATADFIEIYFKGEKENENRGRIVEYLNRFCSADR